MAPPKIPKIGIETLYVDFGKLSEDIKLPGGGRVEIPNIQNFKQALKYHVGMTAHLLALRLKFETWKKENGHVKDFQKVRKSTEKKMQQIGNSEKELAALISTLSGQEAEIEGMRKEGKTIAKKLKKADPKKALAMVTDFDIKARRTEQQIKVGIVSFAVAAGFLEKHAKSVEKAL